MKKICISFGSAGYEGTLKKLKNSAINFFDEVIIYGENDILELKNNFSEHFKNGIGYGYWLWKPFLILKTLEKVEENDIIFYMDATLEFTQDPIEMISLTNLNDIILFSTTYKNSMYCKYDLFHDLNCLSDEYINGPHMNAAMILIKKTKKSVKFITDFFETCKNYHIISDEPNIHGNNFSDFRDHRRDQSILSILGIKNKIEVFRDPSQWGETQKNDYLNSKYKTVINHHRIKF